MAHPLDKIPPGIKVTAQMSPEATEKDLEFVRMLGVTHAVLWTDAKKSSYEYYASRREIFENVNGLPAPILRQLLYFIADRRPHVARIRELLGECGEEFVDSVNLEWLEDEEPCVSSVTFQTTNGAVTVD